MKTGWNPADKLDTRKIINGIRMGGQRAIIGVALCELERTLSNVDEHERLEKEYGTIFFDILSWNVETK